MKQLVTSIIVSIFLLEVLFTSKDLTTKVIVIPFLVFSLAFGIKHILLMMKKKKLANKFSKVYVIAFLIYLFVFLIYWDYVSLINSKYVDILFSVPFWIGGAYFAYKRLINK